MVIEGDLESVHGELSELSDPAGHIVRQGPLAEDSQAEDVDVALSDTSSVCSPSGSQFTSTSGGTMRLDFLVVKEYGRAVQDRTASRGTIPVGKSCTDTHQPPASRPRRLFRFWRWLTCSHGHHHWQIQVGLDLATSDPAWRIHAVRHCLRCRTVEVLE